MVTIGRLVAIACSFVQCVVLSAQDIRANLENVQVKRYLDEVCYQLEDESLVDRYCTSTGFRLDQPRPVQIPVPTGLNINLLSLRYSENKDFSVSESVCFLSADSTAFLVYNLIPKKTYYYQIQDADSSIVAQGCIRTKGRVRMIYVPSLFNVRDLGGWPTTNGRRVRYGMIFRGSEMNGMNVADSADIRELLRLGIKSELDFRYVGENEEIDAAGFSAFGFSREDGNYLCTDNCGCYATHMYHSYWTSRYKLAIDYIVRKLRAGWPVYEHCIWGADRTGMISLLIEGALGVDYSDLAKDYELTSMSAKSGVRRKTLYFDEIIVNINKQAGNTLQEKFCDYLRRVVGISQDNLEFLVKTLTEEYIPEKVLVGDVNEDDAVDIADVVAVYNYMAGVKGDVTLPHADVNGDGAVDIADIVKIYNLMAGEPFF